MTIQAVVFDFGNVIGYFNHMKAMEQLSPWSPLSAEEIMAKIIGGRLEDDYELGSLSEKDFLQQVHEVCELTCDTKVTRKCLADIFWRNRDLCELLPALAARYPLYLLSNTNGIHSERFRVQFELDLQHFQALFLSHEMGVMKPNPNIYRMAQEHIGKPPESLVFIDDLRANIEGAKACGWQGLVYSDTDTLIEDFQQLGIMP